MYQIEVILLALILAPLHVMAEQIEVPNEFVDQTPAQASKVNQNFKVVADGVNAQDLRIQTVEEESSSQKVRIQTVENAIAGPAEMVFLGYAEGSGSFGNNNHYAKNQICKDAYSNSAASVMTLEVWMTFIAEQQMPLPSQVTQVKGPEDLIYNERDTVMFSPLLGEISTQPYCSLSSTGGLNCNNGSSSVLTACMAPAG